MMAALPVSVFDSFKLDRWDHELRYVSLLAVVDNGTGSVIDLAPTPGARRVS